MLGLNAAFIFSYAGAPSELIPLVGFLLLCFALIRAVQARPSKALFIGSVLVFVCGFIYLKQYPFARFAPALGIPYVIIGLSYIFFRLLQVLIDAYQGAITERLSLWRVFNHSCFFLSFVSGPIQRFQEYCDQEDALGSVDISSEAVYEAFSRIVNGCIKIVLFSVLFQAVLDEAHGFMSEGLQGGLYIGAYVVACMSYLMHMYINFSGYMDVVIGVGRLFGFTLPENFDWPLRSANLLDLWRRWHITLGEWFKLYIFNPLVKALGHRFRGPALIPAHGIVAFFVTFFIIGVWHKATVEMLFYGLLIGYGVSANKLYEVEMRKRLGKKRFAKLRANSLYAAFANGLMIAYFGITLTCLWMEMDELRHLVLTLGPAGVILCFAVIIAGAMLVRLALGAFRIGLRPLSSALEYLGRAFFFRQLGLATRLFLLTIILFDSTNDIPEIVYMGF